MKRDMNEATQWRDLLHKKDREIEALHRQIDWLTQQLRRLNGRVYGCSSERSAELQEQLCLFEDASRKAALGESSEASVLCRAAGAYRPVCWRRSCTANMCLRCRFTDRSRSCAGSVVSQQTMSNWVLTAGERWLLPVYHALYKELL